jgi:hypothetical protein
MVVHTGAESRSASSSSSPWAPEITGPPPQMKTGRFAKRRSFAASSTWKGSGATRREGYEPSDGSPQTSERSTGPFCTSNGSAMCAAPGRPVVMALNAARKVRGMSAERSSTAFHLVNGRISAFWSSSVNVKRPREDTDTSVLMASTGTEDSFASTNPGRM